MSVVDEQQYPGMTKDAFKKLIRDTMKHPDDFKELPGGRAAYWNDAEQTIVITNPEDPDGGTAFRPDEKKAYFDDFPGKQ